MTHEDALLIIELLKEIAGLRTKRDGSHDVEMWHSNGNYIANGYHDFDLLPPEPKLTSKWLNIYPFNQPSASPVHLNRKDADISAISNRTHVLEIIYEDGVFVDVIKHKVGE